MRVISRGAWATLSAVTLTTAFAVSTNPAGAAPRGPDSFTATAISPTSTISGSKSTSGRLAQSDTALLKRTDAGLVNVVVKLDYDATSSYRGGLKGLPATSPRVTGKKLSGTSAAEKAYNGYTTKLDRSFRAAAAKKVPGARFGTSLRQVYGGVAMRLPANEARALLAIPGVAAVQSDTLEKPLTVESPQFIGAPTIWNQTGGQKAAGQGVIFADLDTGIWPEHPSFVDKPFLTAPPPTASGQPRACDFGDNPLTAVTDVFVCNHKVIGGQPFLQTYNESNTGEVYATSARDSNGHGTHTTSTAAGDIVTNAPVFGVNRGPISGVAPGAWVMEYKVCGLAGCYGSDSAAAVQQAIMDGANVINFSISGGASPFTDPVEMAFLDAYEAGVFVAASAGNSGPGAGTTDHHGPWVTTVAASTQSRAFDSTLTLTGDGVSASFVGTSITAGVSSATPVVLAQNIPGYDKRCSTPLPAGAAVGQIVACQRGVNGRVEKGYNVKQGGAAGMVLYNLPLADTESDNHFLPAVHLADGTDFLAFMAAHGAVTATFTAGVKANGQGDVMASFSSRGPGGTFLKPDITAPGVQVLAGNTPTPDELASGPAGEYYQAIAGTSMSSPHIAGSGILLKALHPTWTPGEIKSALMTTSTTKVVKEDLTTPADPFDFGAGRVDLKVAGKAPIVFDESATKMATDGENPLTAINLNLPSINVPTMPGTVRVTRTATNVSGKAYVFNVKGASTTGNKISVSPSSGRIAAGASRTFQITITSNAPDGQYFGKVTFTGGAVPVHLPVAFAKKQGAISLTQSCAPTTFAVGQSTVCTVTAQNQGSSDAAVQVDSTVSNGLKIDAATGTTVNLSKTGSSTGPVLLRGPKDGIPSIAAVESPVGGYLGLENFGIAATPIGDEANQNYPVPAFLYGGKSYTRVGVDSNGYLVVGGSDSASDISFIPQTFPDAAPPNGVLAPYWTDMDGTGDAGIRAATLGDGVNNWLVVQWNVHVYGDTSATGQRSMQVWIGSNGTEDITYTYAPETIGLDAPAGTGLTVGAENVTGTAGAQISGPPAGDYRVSTVPGAPGESLTYTLTLRGKSAGQRSLTTSATSNLVSGITTVKTPLSVTG